MDFLDQRGGIIVSALMIYLLKVEEHDAHATAIAVILPYPLRYPYILFEQLFRLEYCMESMCRKRTWSRFRSQAIAQNTCGHIEQDICRFMIMAGLRMLLDDIVSDRLGLPG